MVNSEIVVRYLKKHRCECITTKKYFAILFQNIVILILIKNILTFHDPYDDCHVTEKGTNISQDMPKELNYLFYLGCVLLIKKHIKMFEIFNYLFVLFFNFII